METFAIEIAIGNLTSKSSEECDGVNEMSVGRKLTKLQAILLKFGA